MLTINLSVSVRGRRAASWALIAWAALNLWQPAVLAGGPTCPDPADLYAQCPNFAPNGVEGQYYAYSDLGADVSVADNFTLQAQGTISRIRWWGTYLLPSDGAGCGPSADDDFTVLFWRDADGNPSGPDPLPIPGYTVIRSSEAVGTVAAALGPTGVFEYELTFENEGFQAQAGETYWVEVQNAPAGCAWFWLTGPDPPGEGSSRQRTPSTDPDWSVPTVRRFDLAFSLLSDAGEPIPAASRWGIIALTLLLLTAAAVVLRRDHPHCAAVQRERPHFPPSRGEAS